MLALLWACAACLQDHDPEEPPKMSKWKCLAKVHMPDQVAAQQISLTKAHAISAKDAATACTK